MRSILNAMTFMTASNVRVRKLRQKDLESKRKKTGKVESL